MQKLFVFFYSAAIFDFEQTKKESIQIIKKKYHDAHVGVSFTEYFNRNDNWMLYYVLCAADAHYYIFFSFFVVNIHRTDLFLLHRFQINSNTLLATLAACHWKSHGKLRVGTIMGSIW